MLLRNESEGSKFKFLALDNENDNRQGVITPQRDAIDFLKFCRNVGISIHGARLAALETYVLQSETTESSPVTQRTAGKWAHRILFLPGILIFNQWIVFFQDMTKSPAMCQHCIGKAFF